MSVFKIIIFMKKINKYLTVIVFLLITVISCEKYEDAMEVASLSDIEITATQTSTSITLSWKPVEGCSWYQIYYAKLGESLEQYGSFQDLKTNPITNTISGLKPNTTYDIKVEGTDYLSGGKILASKELKVTTAKP